MSVGFCGSLMFYVITFDVIRMPKFCLGRRTGSGALITRFLAQVPVVVVFSFVVPVAICTQNMQHPDERKDKCHWYHGCNAVSSVDGGLLWLIY